jgi:nucleotide-binding universal stress UspA family protein
MEPLVPKLILVPTDLSEPAAHALRYASALGERFDAHLLVIYADPFVPPVDFTASAAGVFQLSRDVMIDSAREELQRHAEENIAEDVPFDVRVIVGEPLDSILAQVRESGANLIVMGTHGRTGVRRLLFGSVTEAVMRVAPVPVIAVNPAATITAEVKKVLSLMTFTPACRDALLRASALASDADVPFVLLTNVESPDAHMGALELMRLERWVPEELAGRAELKLVSADEDSILQVAADTGADLIALGVPAGRNFAESLRGTIAERVVQRSVCPVLTVNAYVAGVVPVEERELVTA